MTYANQTSVSVEKSRAEIEKLLQRYGADQFVSGWSGSTAAIGFVLSRRSIRFTLPLPARDDPAFRYTPARRYLRNEQEREKAWEQACRSRWRALLLVIKAKLEAVECGISTIEDEFLAWTVIPGTGCTVSQQIGSELTRSIESGEPPRLLLTGGGE